MDTPAFPIPDPQGEAQKASGGDQTSLALLKLLQQSQRPQAAQQDMALPSQMEKQSTTPPAYMTQNAAAHQWGPERFLYTLGASLNNIAQQRQENQLAQAKNMYSSFMTALDKYYTPDGQLDPKFMQDPFIRSMKPQDFKKMSKALAAPWLDPGKTTVEQNAMSQVMKERQAKLQAQHGLKKLFTSLKDRAFKPNPQLSPDQQSQVTSEIANKVPIAGATPNAVSVEAAKALGDISGKQQQMALDQSKLAIDQEKLDYQEYRDSVKQQFDEIKQQSQQTFQETMQRLRDTAAEQRESSREATLLKSLGIKQSEAEGKSDTAALNSSIKSALQDLRQQLSQASTKANQLQSQAQKRDTLWKKLWTSEPDVASADFTKKQLQSAIQLIEKNQGAILSHKVDLDQILDQAQQLANTPPPPPGTVIDAK